MIRKITQISLIISALTFCCFGQNTFIEDGWKGIKILQTNKTAVEKITGKPETITEEGYYNYDNGEFFMHASYSTAPCVKSEWNRGNFNVPADTVIELDVTLSEGIKLSEFKFHRERYIIEKDPHRSDVYYFNSQEDAIYITVGVIDGIEYVGRIRFRRNAKDEKKYACNGSKPLPDKPLPSKSAEKSNCKTSKRLEIKKPLADKLSAR